MYRWSRGFISARFGPDPTFLLRDKAASQRPRDGDIVAGSGDRCRHDSARCGPQVSSFIQ